MRYSIPKLAARKLTLLALEDRTAPAITASLSGTTVTFTGDGANDTLAFTNNGGFLQHNFAGQPGFASSLDLDTSTPGVQQATIASITALNVDLGGGTNSLSFANNVNTNATTTNPGYLILALPASANATLNNSSIAVTNSSPNYTISHTGATAIRVDGGTGDNLIDANAVSLLNVWLRGFEGNDTLIGGSLPDRLDGGDGNDLLEGRDGNEDNTFLTSLNANVGLFGGVGTDTLRGGGGNDFLSDVGPDAVVEGNAGTDFLQMTEAAGVIVSDASIAIGASSSAANTLEGLIVDGDSKANLMDASALTAFPVWFRGFGGNDTLIGSSLQDRLEGRDGNDLIEGRDGNENNTFITLYAANTALIGGLDTDTIFGGNGDDYIEDDGPSGAADGGPGKDFYVGLNASNVLITDTSFSMGGAVSVGNNFEGFRIDGDVNANLLDASLLTLCPVFFRGFGGNDTLIGSALQDRLEGGDGDDLIEGRDGNETNTFITVLGVNGGLYGGVGSDSLRGGNGDDYIEDQGPNGVADGGDGKDFFLGVDAAGATITDTSFVMGTGTSIGNNFEAIRIEGNNNANLMDASLLTLFPVWFRGLGGNDTLIGGSVQDRLEGNDGDDLIEGRDGNETNTFITILGTNGGLYGGAGTDTIFGGNGDDYIEDSGPSGAANGGSGNDFFFSVNVSDAVITDTSFSMGGATSVGNSFEAMRLEGTSGDNFFDASALTSFSVWFRGLNGNDTLIGGSQRDRLEGNNGDDIVEGRDGDETNTFISALGSNGGVYGGPGNDKLFGGNGNDYLEDEGPIGAANGGPGTDFHQAIFVTSVTVTNTSLTYGGAASIGNDIEGCRIEGTSGNDFFDASASTTTAVWFRGLDGNDTLLGSSQPDRLEGNLGDDYIEGNAGNENQSNNPFLNANVVVTGDAGNDTLFGGSGDDSIFGGAGDDVITGGDGNDSMQGDDGDDTFYDGPEINAISGNAGKDSVFLTATPLADLITVSNGIVTINGKSTTYNTCEVLTIDAGAGVDHGEQKGAISPADYVVNNLEPTVDAGPDATNLTNPFLRVGTFTDIGFGQSWTGEVDYGEGGGFVPISVDQAKLTYNLNHSYSAGGAFLVRVRITDNQGNVGEDTFTVFRPVGVQVGVAGGAQRSMIEKLVVSFATTYTLNPGWYTFQRLSPGMTPTVSESIVNSGGMTKATLTFGPPGLDPGPSLQDGDYRLTLNTALILDSMNQPFDGDGDGNPGGNFIFNFHRLFGDGNGDRTVDGNDFTLFGAAFGSSTGGPGYTTAFDYQTSGLIDGDDFAQFGNRFGVTI